MCGAGGLPARMAAEARRQDWRVIAFAFDDAAGVDAHAARVVPSRVTDLGTVLATAHAEGVSAALFAGRFSMPEVLRADAAAADAVARAVARRATSRIDARLAEVVIATLTGLGIEVLDQRGFVGGWLPGGGCWTRRAPSDAEWADVRRGLAVARILADAHIGQTVVVRHGVIAAAEAVEGTTEAIRRGAALAGAGAVVVKAVGQDHDYRFDLPAIGPETVEAAMAGGATVLALEAGRVMIVEREATIAAADAAGIAVVGVEASS
jgi:DUF1009 family protein